MKRRALRNEPRFTLAARAALASWLLAACSGCGENDPIQAMHGQAGNEPARQQARTPRPQPQRNPRRSPAPAAQPAQQRKPAPRVRPHITFDSSPRIELPKCVILMNESPPGAESKMYLDIKSYENVPPGRGPAVWIRAFVDADRIEDVKMNAPLEATVNVWTGDEAWTPPEGQASKIKLTSVVADRKEVQGQVMSSSLQNIGRFAGYVKYQKF